ncbi:MAG TPA: hypothetical protein VD838_00430, partial [Anaeromyxobacteraceae bacterium]|nr:hypothetical protein [Anaeromyxobacteraceae bacterium]
VDGLGMSGGARVAHSQSAFSEPVHPERSAAEGGAKSRDAYPYGLERTDGLWQLDLRPLWRALAADAVERRDPAVISARFHEALADAGAALVRRAAEECGKVPVILTGGCFQNARLVEGILRRLRGSFAVYQHAFVPPGDGGIALGQAIVADAVLTRSSTHE